MIYLDNASTTKPFKEVLDHFNKYYVDFFANPSSSHFLGQKTKIELENCRLYISEILKCKSNEIIFTSGATEANNLAIKGIIKPQKIKNIITSKLEHPSVLKVLDSLENIDIFFIENDENGVLDLENLENLLASSKGNTLVTIMHINNEIGNLNDIKKIGQISKKYGAFFHTDAVQSIGKINVDLKYLEEVDLLSSSSHKFNGFKGSGFLFCRESIKLEPQILGGGQENSRRSGTENVFSILAMKKALEINISKGDNETYKIKKYLIDKLKNDIPKINFIGHNVENSSPVILNISLPTNKSMDSILLLLEMKSIIISSGSACKSGASKISSVIQHLNPSFYPNLRISLSGETTYKDIDTFVKELKSIL